MDVAQEHALQIFCYRVASTSEHGLRGADYTYLRRPRPPRIPPSNPRMISRPTCVPADRSTLFTMLVAMVS